MFMIQLTDFFFIDKRKKSNVQGKRCLFLGKLFLKIG